MRVAELATAAKAVSMIYTDRASVTWAAKVRGDLFSQMMMFPGPTDPYPLYERMRARGPLLPTRLGNHTTTSYAISREVLRDRRFGVVPDEPEHFSPRDLVDLSLLSMNPPEHTRLRRLAGPSFNPRRMGDYATLVDEVVSTVLDDAERRGTFDLMSTVASPIPILVISRLLGLPADPERFRVIGSTLAKALDGLSSLGQARRLRAVQLELHGILADLIAEKQRHPGQDLTSYLLADMGTEVSSEDLTSLVQLLLVAGFETTVNAIGNGIHWLLADRRQWEWLVAQPERSDSVTEEVLRFDPPVQLAAMVANQPVEVAGRTVAKNQFVICLVAAANRDPDVYERPDQFDVTRVDPPEHLTFSGGVHYCLGAPLARMEISRTLRALAERFPDLRLTGPIRMRPGSVLRGPSAVPLAVR